MRILFCDDTKEEIVHFQRMIEQTALSLKISVDFVYCVSASQLLFEMEELRSTVDIILLDISMPPGINGIQAARKLRSLYDFQGEILFVSKSSAYILEAFDVGAFHYIIKNETPDKKQLEIITKILSKADKKRKDVLMLKGIGEYRNIPIKDIYYFEAKNHLIEVHYGAGEIFAFYSSFDKLLDRLSFYNMVRVHRSFLSAVDQIQTFSYKGILFQNKEFIPVGRKYLPDLKKAMGVKKKDS